MKMAEWRSPKVYIFTNNNNINNNKKKKKSVGHLIRKSDVLGSIPGLATYFRFSFR